MEIIPNEILSIIAEYVRSTRDIVHLMLSCKTVYNGITTYKIGLRNHMFKVKSLSEIKDYMYRITIYNNGEVIPDEVNKQLETLVIKRGKISASNIISYFPNLNGLKIISGGILKTSEMFELDQMDKLRSFTYHNDKQTLEGLPPNLESANLHLWSALVTTAPSKYLKFMGKRITFLDSDGADKMEIYGKMRLEEMAAATFKVQNFTFTTYSKGMYCNVLKYCKKLRRLTVYDKSEYKYPLNRPDGLDYFNVILPQ